MRLSSKIRRVGTLGFDDLPAMATFARVLQLRSFTAAAEEQQLAKSAVSRRIAQLEARLGVRLLARNTRKLAPTEDGLRLYEHCAALLVAAQTASESISDAARVPRGKLRINAPVTLSHMVLVHAVKSFLLEYPEIECDLTSDDRIIDMVEGGFDLVIRISRMKDSALVARRLGTDRLVVCAAPEYLARHGVPQTPDDLLDHHCLHYNRVPLFSEWRFRTGEKVATITRFKFASSDGTVLRCAAKEGLGLAVLPFFMVAADVASGALRLVLEGRRRGEIGIFALTGSRAHLPVRARLLLGHLVKFFERKDWRTAGSAAL
jgi:DNA-binding transcriptional LysR family regulator